MYLGTPQFAVKPLQRLLEIGADVVAVITNPDKPVGRKHILTPPPVKVLAQSCGIPVYQYKSIRKEGVDDLISLKPDLMITCAFGQILSREILDIPRLGVYNIHGSLLPKYRGASPVQSAILNGEKVTGITVMKTEEGIDTGDMLFSESIDIPDDCTAGELFDTLSDLGADCIERAVNMLESGNYTLTPQNDALATHTGMITKEQAFCDFGGSATEFVNKVRAYNPSPVAYTLLDGQPLKIYRAAVVDKSGIKGEVLTADGELVVACEQGAVRLITVQKAGGRAMESAEFLRGQRIERGSILGK